MGSINGCIRKDCLFVCNNIHYQKFLKMNKKDNNLIGKRIRMIYMDDPFPILPNELGTIIAVDDINSYHVKWDNGRTLHVLYEDKFEIINDENKIIC